MADRLDAGKLKGEIMGAVYKKTATKPLPAGAKIIVRKGQRLVRYPDAVPPEPTPENLARPALARRKAKRKAK